MRRISIWMVVICLFILTACGQLSPSGNDTTTVTSAYKDLINQLSMTNDDIYYALKDIDGNKIDDLIIQTNTLITVYTFHEKIIEVGSHDFVTGTMRLLHSNNPTYPGIIYYTVGGGADHYGYMTIKNNELFFEPLWEDNYAGLPEGSSDRIKEISSDKQLIAESKSAYKENRDIQFTPVGGERAQNKTTVTPAYLDLPFGTGDAEVVSVVSKGSFSSAIFCNYNGQALKVNTPIYTGLPVDSVYSYKVNYSFEDGASVFHLALEDGAKNFLIDRTGKILDDDYTIPNTIADNRPATVGNAISGGENMYFYHTDDLELLGLMNSSGAKLTEPIFYSSGQFLGGYAAVTLADKVTHVVIDTQGNIISTLPTDCSASVRGNGVVVVQTGTPGAYEQQLYSVTGEILSIKYDSIGYFYNGLALIEADNKVGLLDEEGNEVLKPCIAYDKIIYPPKNSGYRLTFMTADAFVIPIDGEFAIITIER